jgi:hypothetical protein
VFGRPLASVVYGPAIRMVWRSDREQVEVLVASREVMEPAMRAVCRANEESKESDMIASGAARRGACVCVHWLLHSRPPSLLFLLFTSSCSLPAAGSIIQSSARKRSTRRSETVQFVRQIDSKRAADLMSARRIGLGGRPRSI